MRKLICAAAAYANARRKRSRISPAAVASQLSAVLSLLVPLPLLSQPLSPSRLSTGLLNEYTDWWYIVICFVALAPLFVAVGMFIAFFSKDTEGTRTGAFASCQLVIISVSLFCIWNTIYFLYFYKKDRIYFGNTETGYITLTKRQYFFWLFFFTAAVDASYMYFICVTSAYSDRLKPKEVPPAMMEKMKEMMEEMMEEKMEEMMEEKMEEKMEEMAME